MRILIATGIFEPESGGPATYTPQLASKLAAKGFDVTVITYSDSARLDADAAYPFKLVRVVRGGKILNRIRFFFAVLKHARGCDVIYTLDWFAAGLPVAIAAKLLGKPYIVRVGGDYLWEKYFESGIVTPCTLTEFYEDGIHMRRLHHTTFRIIRFVLRNAAHVVFNSGLQHQLYLRFYGLDDPRTSTIYNPTPHVETAHIARDAPNKEIVFFGRLVVMKNVGSLIRAFARASLPAEYTLTIIGDGPQKNLLQELVRELHLEDRVKMVPGMSKIAVLERVKNARAFVLPSWIDIAPNQVYEALAIGLPALVTKENYLPIRDQLSDMIDPRSVDDIAEKLKMLADDARYAAFSAAFNAIRFDHDWDTVVQEHIALFGEIRSPQKTPPAPREGISVLQIGADRSKRGILYPDSQAVARQKAYGEHFGALDIVGFSLTGDKRLPFEASSKVHIYPTNSTSRLFYGLDTIRIARRLYGHASTQGSGAAMPDVISAQDPFETGLLGVLMSWMMGVPLHVQVHTDLLSPAYARHSLINRMRVSIAWFVLRRAARIRVVSERIKRSLEEQWGIKTPITVLPIFLDIERLKRAVPDIALSMRFAESKHKILVVARLEPEKNVALAIHAFAQVAPPDACLIIVGDGSERGHLVSLVRKLSIKNQVFFEGEKDSLLYYALADLVLVTSHYEGYGIVIVEALAAELPVISTDVGVAREMGAVIAEPQYFAQALAAWFAVPEDRPRATGIKGYPYKDFEEYAKAYAEDIKACIGTEK